MSFTPLSQLSTSVSWVSMTAMNKPHVWTKRMATGVSVTLDTKERVLSCLKALPGLMDVNALVC